MTSSTTSPSDVNGPFKTEIADGLLIEWDVPIPMADGIVLRADIFRPPDDGVYPVIMNYGPYGKGLPFDVGFPSMWKQLVDDYPEAVAQSTNKYRVWELVDPERWVPEGYAIVRVDSRGAGRSPGMLDCFSPQETQDFYECIEWAAVQPWSSGKVGLDGTSYHAINAWQVAALQPPHLAAICAWEGCNDWYREAGYHGGMRCTFLDHWYAIQVGRVQHGIGSRGERSPLNGLLVAGDEDFSEEELAANRRDMTEELRSHPFDGEYWRGRSADLSKITVPILSGTNWGGQGLHSRGNFRGFTESASTDKWLEVHGREHVPLFYTDYGRGMQLRFFNYFLKGEGDWPNQPPVQLLVRHPNEQFILRTENEWPIARTKWTKLYFDVSEQSLIHDVPKSQMSISYEPFVEGVTLSTVPFKYGGEITGPIAAKIWISSETTDADLFLVLRLFDPSGKEVLFRGPSEPRAPVAQGWLRASHRALDEKMSKPWAPYHPHLVSEPLVKGEIYELDIEIWPTSIVVPIGYRLALSVLGKDYDHGLGATSSHLGTMHHGCGHHVHNDSDDRPAAIYNGSVTIYAGGDTPSYLMLPVIPAN